MTVIGSTLFASACAGGGDDTGAAASDAVTGTTAPDPTVAEGATGNPSAGGPNTCELLEGIEPSALLGEPAGDPQPDGTVCRVSPASATSRGQMGLVVETDRPDDNFAIQREVFGVDAEVADLGDAAFHSGSYLFVLDGDTFFFLQVVRDAALGLGVPDGDLEAAARTVIENVENWSP